jgi:hypothetical protein
MDKRVLTAILLALCPLTGDCVDSGEGDRSGQGGSGGIVTGSADAVAPALDGASTDGPGAGGNGGRDAAGSRTCGPVSCNPALEYCRASIPGPESVPSYSCLPSNGCERCECLAVDPRCSCALETTGFIVVTCHGV